MDGGSWYCRGGSDQDHPQGKKKCKKAQWLSEEAKHRQLCGLLKATQLGSWPGWVSSPGSQASESVPLKGQTTKHSPGTHLWERQIFIQCLIISDLRLLPGDSAGSSAWLPVAWATRPGFHCMCRPSPFLPCQKGRKCVPCVFFLLTFLSSKFVGLVSQSPDSDILMLALISKSKSDNILLEMHNFSERKHLTICIVNVPKRPLANKNDNKARWGFQIISAATIRHFSKCVDSCAVLSHSVVSHSLRLHELEPARLLCPWGFSRQEYWSGLPCTPPGDLPNPGIELRSPALQADSLTVWVTKEAEE